MQEDIVYIDIKKPEKKPDRRLKALGQFEEGGMSSIMEAMDTNLMRRMAMKVLKDDKIKDKYEINRMVFEAQLTAQLDHPNIVPIHELGIDKKKRLFFTMKKVRGKPLYELIESKDFSVTFERDYFRLVQIMIKVCDAVSYAHSKGVLHRDLKPDNIMVGKFGQVYLMDWGIACIKRSSDSNIKDMETPKLKKQRGFTLREEEQGDILGTPCYMSPEQAHGDINAIDERSDVFSLGATLYEILTGTYPIKGKSPHQMVINARECKIKPPNEIVLYPLPVGLVRITMKAVSKDPAERYQSVRELKKALEGFLEGSERFLGRTYKPGELIVRENEQGNEAYIIREGRCRAFKTVNGEKTEMRIMGKGDVFGETAILTGKPRTASVESIDTVTVAVVSSHYFEEELDPGNWLSPFIRALAERFREADQLINHRKEK
ncbi:protein kinase [Thermodesulfobacteriota bacterium]